MPERRTAINWLLSRIKTVWPTDNTTAKISPMLKAISGNSQKAASSSQTSKWSWPTPFKGLLAQYRIANLQMESRVQFPCRKWQLQKALWLVPQYHRVPPPFCFSQVLPLNLHPKFPIPEFRSLIQDLFSLSELSAGIAIREGLLYFVSHLWNSSPQILTYLSFPVPGSVDGKEKEKKNVK